MVGDDRPERAAQRKQVLRLLWYDTYQTKKIGSSEIRRVPYRECVGFSLTTYLS